VVALLVEVAHTDLSEVARMVLVHVGSMMMLTTSKTTTTGMLSAVPLSVITQGNLGPSTARDYPLPVTAINANVF
jgi:hypothetical protein